MRILQAGYMKSGNYWLWKILDTTMAVAGLERKSYIKSLPLHGVARTWDLSFPEQADIDFIHWKADGDRLMVHHLVVPIYRKTITDMEEFLGATTHVWTHGNLLDLAVPFLSRFDKIVYILRDPRDVALSHVHFDQTPFQAREVGRSGGTFEERARRRTNRVLWDWASHVSRWLLARQAHPIHCLCYERLVHSFDEEYEGLLSYLGLELDEGARREVAEAVAFRSMRKASPGHVNRGRTGTWAGELPWECCNMVTERTRPLLALLGYPLSEEELYIQEQQGALPLLPETGSPRASMVLEQFRQEGSLGGSRGMEGRRQGPPRRRRLQGF